MRLRLVLLFGIISLVSSCQTNRLALGTGQHTGTKGLVTQEMLLHDSQGPQATRVTMTAAEAAAFRQQ